ncbi:hypothetical protein AAZV13_17G183600 [Glycine max]
MDSAHVIVENKGSGTNMSFNLGKDLNYLVLPYSDEENLKGAASVILMATGMRLRCENYLQGSQRKKTIITLSNYTLVRGNKNPEQKGSNICINYCHQNISC